MSQTNVDVSGNAQVGCLLDYICCKYPDVTNVTIKHNNDVVGQKNTASGQAITRIEVTTTSTVIPEAELNWIFNNHTTFPPKTDPWVVAIVKKMAADESVTEQQIWNELRGYLPVS